MADHLHVVRACGLNFGLTEHCDMLILIAAEECRIIVDVCVSDSHRFCDSVMTGNICLSDNHHSPLQSVSSSYLGRNQSSPFGLVVADNRAEVVLFGRGMRFSTPCFFSLLLGKRQSLLTFLASFPDAVAARSRSVPSDWPGRATWRRRELYLRW